MKVFMFVNVDWFFLSHRLPIAEASVKNDINMSVYTDFTDIDFNKENLNFNFLQSPISRTSRSIFSFFSEFLKTLHIIIKEKPALIHAVTIKPIIFLGLISLVTKTPFVAAISGFGPVLNQKSFLNKIRLKLVFITYKLILLPSKTSVICQNRHDKSILLKNKICNENKIEIIPGSGVNLKKFEPKMNKNKSPFILMASRILVDKGIIEYCEASKIFKENSDNELSFKLAGPIDPDSPTSINEYDLVTLCKENGVEYLGNRKDIQDLLASALLFIFPSYYPEGIPKVLIEAAACGTPVITTNHPGCRDAVLNNITGIILDSRDSQDISKAINLLVKDKEKIKKMSLASRRFAEEYFDELDVIESHYKIYKKIGAK